LIEHETPWDTSFQAKPFIARASTIDLAVLVEPAGGRTFQQCADPGGSAGGAHPRRAQIGG
jgi:hypothetical protein